MMEFNLKTFLSYVQVHKKIFKKNHPAMKILKQRIQVYIIMKKYEDEIMSKTKNKNSCFS